MKRTAIMTLSVVALFTACNTSKKSTQTTATVEAPKENKARVEKVVPPADTQPQKAEVLYDR